MFLFFALEFLLFAFVFIMLHLAWRPLFLGEAPFMPSPRRAVETVIRELELTPKSILYDLGCGDGRILFECVRRNPTIKAVGIEYDFIPWSMAQLERRKFPHRSQVEFIKGDMFKQKYSDATHLFLFTYPNIMARLLPKLEAELAPGTRLVSLDFPFAGKLPKKVVALPGREALGKYIYVYEF